MALSRGARLGPYEIDNLIGAGGMGEVYRALDTRLNRAVAIKIIPQHMAGDPERRERFEREARAVSSLNHPHICTLYDVGQHDDIHYLVMEYVEGDTLQQRLEQGPLSLDQALQCAIQIGDALDKAHRQGVIHRDLKPGNIILSRSGAKLLDFGLAKLKEDSRTPSTLSALPTNAAVTAQGTILGTMHYMAPEQLEGKEADARADIWAFGCLLYEMVSGRRAFDGPSHASLISAIMVSEPRPLSTTMSTTPALDRLLKTCLQKDPDLRWQSSGDLRRELQWIHEAPGAAEAGAPARSSRPLILVSTLLVLALVGTGIMTLRHLTESTAEPPPIRFTITPAGSTIFSGAANSIQISPDGTHLLFVGETAGIDALWVRALDGLEAKPLAGTEGARQQFWSPDSRSAGFFAGGKLKTVELASGAVKTLADARGPAGAAWGPDGTIIFSPTDGPLFRVSSSGGSVTQIQPLDAARKESTQRWPMILPGGRHFLYVSVISTGEKENAIYIGSLDSDERRRLLDVDSQVVYTPAGFVLYQREGALVAQRFDVAKLSLVGDPQQIAPSVDLDRIYRSITASVSDNGILVYRPGIPVQRELLWMDRAGRKLESVGEPDAYYHPSLSPDGSRLAIGLTDPAGNGGIWTIDLQRRTRSRIATSAAIGGGFPQWSPDGRRLLFMANPSGPEDLFMILSSGGGKEELFYASDVPHKHPQQWTKDDKYILYDSSGDIWALPIMDRKPFRVVGTDASEAQPRLSPDGQWIAYASDETGRPEVYVQPFPPNGDKWQISTSGGGQPRWRADGKELFYLSSDRRVVAVSVKADRSFEASLPQNLFEAPVTFIRGGSDLAFPDSLWLVASDGQRFFFLAPVETSRNVPATVITNWTRLVDQPK